MAVESFNVVQPKSMGPLKRLFGSLGVDKDGTEFEIEHVDPFLMCDFISMPINLNEPPMRPPFCAHPHCGNLVASILIEGEDHIAWDNVQGSEAEKLTAGGVYVLTSGQGCVHDESPDAVVLERIIRRAPFGLPGDERPACNWIFFQLWMDVGHVHAEETPPVSSTVLRPDAVPIAQAGAMKVRVLVGEYEGSVGVDLPVNILHGALLPFTGSGVITIPAGRSGFIFSISRDLRVSIGEQKITVPKHQELLLPLRLESYEISLDVDVDTSGPPEQAQADEALHVLLCYGPPIDKPFFKLLGYGGALIASSEEKVRSKMLEYEKDPKKFGVCEGNDSADTSFYGLQTGYKDPLDGRGECQRADCSAPAPEARFYLLEKGPYQPKGKGKGK